MYFNKAIIIGNLTRDPETKALPSGSKLCSFSVATSRYYKDKNGVRQEDTQYHNVVVFGPQADVASQYLRKGSSVLIEGRMQTRSWDAQDGQKKYRTEIICEALQLGPRREGGATPTGNFPAPSTPSSSSGPTLETIEYPDEEINPDDIPF
jgi:single-strand DNA-binding protein